MNEVFSRFPELTACQRDSFSALGPAYRLWNERINVISRKDIDSLEVHHVLHSLAIAKAVDFPEGSRILDVGTGGGFLGIPLAILCPGARFVLCDSVGKKIRVAEAVAAAAGLSNVTCVNGRAEVLPGPFDCVVSRAVAPLDQLYGWVQGKFLRSLICLKGGDVAEEVARCAGRFRLSPAQFTVCDMSLWFEDPYFAEKKIVILSK